MGVRGLTTYIAENADRYLDPLELHDCNVVIDGDSLSCQLYKSINSAFGGNYDHYFRVVCNFFEMLKQCNVTSYVLLDGGYQPKKLVTVKQRLRSKIGAIKHLNPFNCQPTFPILMREVFVEALEHCGVQLMRCMFEADDEVAALSRKLKCPILSFDSDFYIHDVIYIPSVSLTMKVFRRNVQDTEVKKKVSLRKVLVSEIDTAGEYRNFKAQKVAKDAETQNNKCYYYMQCSVYSIANLTRDRGLRAEMLPLFAILLGNDYISSSIFKKFFLNVSMKQTGRNSTRQGKRIIALLRWLQRETLTSAIDKIINHVEKDRKDWLRYQIKIGIAGYIHEKSVAYDFFGLSDTTVQHNVFIKPVMNAASVTIESDASDDSSNESENEESELQTQSDDDSNEEDEDNEELIDNENVEEHAEDETKQKDDKKENFTNVSSFTAPDWLLEKIFNGKLPRYIVDLMTMRLYINAPQVENFQLPDCNLISIRILQLIFTILHQPKHIGKDFRYLTRVQRRTDIEYKRFESLSIDTSTFKTNGDNNHEFFKLVLNDFENAEEIFNAINTVPVDMRLFFIAIIYWSKYSKHFNVVYVSALVLCQIGLSMIDSHVNPIRDRVRFEKAFNPNSIQIAKAKPTGENDSQKTIDACRVDVTRNECILAQSNLLDLYSLNQKLRTKHTEFSSDIVHGFAEFQSIVYQLNCLNVLCGEPYQNIVTSGCVNGCFLFNTYTALKDRPNIKYYIQKFLLIDSPNLYSLFEAMISILTPFVACLSKETISKRKKQRNINKKKSREQRNEQKSKNESDTVCNSNNDNQPESDFEDLNNRFACLLKN